MESNEIEFSEIMATLQKKAEADGKVTKEEEKFLQSLRSDVDDYQIGLNESKQDGVISDDEFQNLVVLRDAILNTAMGFDSDSEDINALVQELFDEINKHEMPGMAEDEMVDSEIDPVDED